MFAKNDYVMASVIVPIYKVEKYLSRCIESILAQSYENLEIILVDDGSPDSCGTICDQYKDKDSRIYVIHKKNGGLSDARNVGIQHSTGDYLFFIDSDDWVDPDYCSSAIADLENQKADIVVFGYNKVDESNNLIETCCVLDSYICTKEEAILGLFNERIENYAWNKVYRSKVFDGIMYPMGRLWEDIGTTYRVFDKCTKIYVSNRVTYNYLIRNSSITGVHSFKADIDIFLQRKEQYDFLLKKYPSISIVALNALIISAIQAYIHIPQDSSYYQMLEDVKSFLLDKKSMVNKVEIKSAKLKAFYKSPRMFRYLSQMLLFARKHKRKEGGKTGVIVRVFNKIRRQVRQNKNRKDIRKLWNQNYKKRIYVIGTPDHDNLGDHAIALSTIQFLHTHFQDYDVIDITEDEYWEYKDSLTKRIDACNDLIVLQGGGNLGNQYMYIERIRRDAIHKLKVKKVVFPQTMYFTNDFVGQRELELTKKIYAVDRDLILLAREKISYKLMKKQFNENQVFLVPDIVLRYRIQKNCQKREGILLCFRTDKEAALDFSHIKSIKNRCLQIESDVKFTDTCIKKNIEKKDRDEAVHQKLIQFAGAKLVITDRLHGMIFAALTATPCIVLANYNHKILGVYEWIIKLKYVRYLESEEQLNDCINELLNNHESLSYDYDQIDSNYAKIVDCMRN